LARAGQLTEAPVVFTEGAHLPLAGLLLILPGLAATGLLEAFEQTYGRLRHGFYGLRTTVLMVLFLALLRDPRAEGATRIRPADLGRLLGLDRAPEVKTLRRKLTELASQAKGAALQAALAQAHARACPDALGFCMSMGTPGCTPVLVICPKPTWPACIWPRTPTLKPGSLMPRPTRSWW
jgi:hypothetical protein